MRPIILCAAAGLAAACTPGSEPGVPAVEDTPSFVGSDACRACHAGEFEAWLGSHHELAMQPATPETVLGDFGDGARITHFGTTTTFAARGASFSVSTENADGNPQEFEIAYVFGVYPLQQYLVEFPDGRLQVLPTAWDSRPESEGGQRWFHIYPDEPVPHGDVLHWTGAEQNWNYMCAECHSTNLVKNYEPGSDSFRTTWTDINVGCEACHGAGAEHVRLAGGDSGRPPGGLTMRLDDAGRAAWEMDPQTGIARRSEPRMRPPAQPEACGRCHSRRSVAASGYEFSSSLFDTHLPSLLEDPLYFADGQIREEVYVYGSFLQSRMYQAGVSCSDCHDPHSARLKTAGGPSGVCAGCHLPTVFQSREHHRHAEDSVECVDCHMTARTYMVVDDRRDHSFRVPDPAMSAAVGSPDACTACHADKEPDWAAAAVRDWYGEDVERHYGYAIHAGRGSGRNDALIAAAGDLNYPGIARGTILALLRPPYSPAVADAVRRALADPDPFVRRGALIAARGLDAQALLGAVLPLLEDPLRAIRNEAARTVSPLREALPPQWLSVFRDAEAGLVDALEAIAERPEAQMGLAVNLIDAGRAELAEDRYRQALRLAPASAAVAVNLADLYRQMGRDQDAEAVLREALDKTPTAGALHYSLGLLLVRAGRAEDGLEALARAAQLEPGNARFAYVFAVALNSTGQAAEATDRLAEAARRFPMEFDVRWALATMLRDQGRLEDARAAAAGLALDFPGVASVDELSRSLNASP